MLDALVASFQELFRWQPLLAFIVMVPIAFFSGIMPGGTLPVTVVVLGFATRLDPTVAMVLVLSHIAIAELAEAIPAILIGVPGGRGAQATVLDGYPMARKGLAGVALGANYTASLIGGLIGGLALLVTIPVARELLRLFGSAEFFLLSVLGVAAVAVVSSGAMVKGLLTAALGFAISLVGFSNIGGISRLTFGVDYLFDGIPLVPVVVGLFAVPELVDLVVSDQTIAKDRLDVLMQESRRDVLRGMVEALHHKWLIVRSSLIGVFVGIMPGLGASAAHWIAYVQARQTEKDGTKTFGTGDIRGLIASDSANNSSEGGALIPTVFFAIPGSGGMAVFLGLLVLLGFTPGPQMLNQHLDIVLVMVWVVSFSVVLVLPVQLYMASMVARLSTVQPNVLFPLVVGIIILTTFQTTNSMDDLVMTGACSVLGMFMKRYGWPRPPILIAVVLSTVVEKYLWISTQTLGWRMLLRVPFIVVLLFVVITVLYSVRVQNQARRTGELLAAKQGAEGPHLEEVSE